MNNKRKDIFIRASPKGSSYSFEQPEFQLPIIIKNSPMSNNFSVDQIRERIRYHRDSSVAWLTIFNNAVKRPIKCEAEKNAIYHCNKLLVWEALFEKVTGKPYYPDPEADPHKTVKDA